MPAATETQLDAVVHQAFPPNPLAHACSVKQVHRALLQNTRADSLLDVLSRLALNHDRVDSPQVQQLRKNQTRRTRSDDSNLRAKCFVQTCGVGASACPFRRLAAQTLS